MFKDVLIGAGANAAAPLPGGVSTRKSLESSPGQSPKILGEKGGVSELSGKKNLAGGKKRVRFMDWEKAGDLVEIKVFEVDDSERGNVSKMGSATDMKHFEMQREKISLQEAKVHAHMPGKQSAQEEEAYISWKLITFDGACDLIGDQSGINSKEKLIESERQKHILEFVILSKFMMPDTPHEPDASERVAPKDEFKEIPLEDVGDDDLHDEESSSSSAFIFDTTMLNTIPLLTID